MAKQTGPARSRPPRFAGGKIGVIFFFAALGLALGTAWYCLVQPAAYKSEARVDVALSPPGASPVHDWADKRREWSGVFRSSDEIPLLTNNLRHIYKQALARGTRPAEGVLHRELSLFSAPQEFSASLFTNPVAARLGRTVTVSAHDLAENLDYQSLAAIIADLDPIDDVPGWDFSFFTPAAGVEDAMIVRPGGDDRYFRVFYRLYDIYSPNRPAASAAEAWRAAVDILADRIQNELLSAGRGRFGPIAERELHLELQSIPVLAANGLYHARQSPGDQEHREYGELWDRRWREDLRLEPEARDEYEAVLSASARLELTPLAFPRDNALTRLPPVMVATALAHISARAASSPPPVAAVRERPAAVAPRPAPQPAPRAVVQSRPVIDDAELERRTSRMAEISETLTRERLDRDDAGRRLEAAREHERRLTAEAIAARSRADRLSERHDVAGVFVARDWRPEVPPETVKLMEAREEAVKRLTALLQYCTEEHPFVREVRREIDALDILLAGHAPRADAGREAEVRATRLANLAIELETAVVNADNLEERLRRQTEAADCIVRELSDAERRIVELEAELARLREAPVPYLAATEIVVEQPPEPEVKPEPEAPRAEPVRGPSLVFGAVPSRIPLLREPKSLLAPVAGLAAGLALGCLWALAAGLLSKRFRDGDEAAKKLSRPVLAGLPLYDPASCRAAAAAMAGDLAGTRAGAMVFTPSPVDVSEPAPAGRRPKLIPVRRRPRLAPWLLGLGFLLAAALLCWIAAPALARPLPGYPEELTVASAAAAPASYGDGQDWGDLP